MEVPDKSKEQLAEEPPSRPKPTFQRNFSRRRSSVAKSGASADKAANAEKNGRDPQQPTTDSAGGGVKNGTLNKPPEEEASKPKENGCVIRANGHVASGDGRERLQADQDAHYKTEENPDEVRVVGEKAAEEEVGSEEKGEKKKRRKKRRSGSSSGSRQRRRRRSG